MSHLRNNYVEKSWVLVSLTVVYFSGMKIVCLKTSSFGILFLYHTPARLGVDFDFSAEDLTRFLYSWDYLKSWVRLNH